MYIVKPKKGFVIPVEYMMNDKLYKDGKDISMYDVRNTASGYEKTGINSVHAEKDEIEEKRTNIEINEDSVSGKLVNGDIVSDKHDGSVITAILDDKEGKDESGSGMFIFDDVIENNDGADGVEIDENKFMELDKARGNLRKAIEVEIEKVGKLVLDDSETEIDSKVSVKSADVQIDNEKADELEENIVTDEARADNNEQKSEDEISERDDLENITSESITLEGSISEDSISEAEAVENSSDDQ